MAGIREVALKAGVSTATVARVLHDSARVSQDLTERVRSAIAELDYVPNAVARSLTSGRSGVIGLLVPDIANPFYAEVARGLEDQVSQHDNQVLIGSSDLRPDREIDLARAFEARMVDAVACTPSAASGAHLRRLQSSGRPVLFIDRSVADVEAPVVGIDNVEAAAQATRYLLDLGHRRIAMFVGPDSFSSSRARLHGYRAAMRAARVGVLTGYIQKDCLGIEGGARAVKRILSLSPRPTAILSFNNLVAVGALGSLRAERIQIPNDISLMTFDDMSLFPYVDPPITVIAQPGYQAGREAGRLLCEMLARPSRATSDVLLPTELVIRASCSAPGEPASARQSE